MPDPGTQINPALIDVSLLQCPDCRSGSIEKKNYGTAWICTNKACNSSFSTVEEVPVLFDRKTISILERDLHRSAEFTYDGILNNSVYNWSQIFLDCDRSQFDRDIDFPYHLDAVQGTVAHKIVRGKTILEIGTGGGIDGRKLAAQDEVVQYYGIDIGYAAYYCNKSTYRRKNQRFIRASALNLPFKDNIFDVVYSYGVFHHTPDPDAAFAEAVRVLKPGGAIYTYMYEKHEDNKIKQIPLEMIEQMHSFTRKLSYKQLKFFCYLLSPFVLLFSSYPGQILKKFRPTRNIGLKFPLHHGTSPKSIIGDLLDRFGASINYRYTADEFKLFFTKNRLENIVITKISDRAGHLGWGFKKL